MRRLELVASALVAVILFACQNDHATALSIQLKNTTGKAFKMSEIQSVKASCFFFLSPECPLSQNYSLTINQLREAYNPDSIPFYGVFPGEFYSKKEIVDFTNKYKMSEYEMLLDPEYQLTDKLEATITPEVFVLDNKGNTLYSGAIDNWAFALGQKLRKAT